MAENNKEQVNKSSKTFEDDTKTEFDENGLLSLEKMDRASPELWPEKIPGITDFISMSETKIHTPAAEWTRGLTKEEYQEMMELSQLPLSGIVKEIKKLYDDAYQLGLREANEMSRGKCLGIFNDCKKK